MEQLDAHVKTWPMSPLLISCVQQAFSREVGREGLILACLMEAEAITFIPEKVAAQWATSDLPSSDTSKEAQTFHGDHPRTLLDLCRVLEDLKSFLRCAYADLGVDSTEFRKTRQHKLMDVKVSVNKLKKASALWLQIDKNN